MEQLNKKMFLESLNKFGFCDVIINGKSMWPFILPKDKIHIVKIQSQPSFGDVVAFFSKEQLIIHRIINIESLFSKKITNFKVCGDSSYGSTGIISSSQIIGKALYLIRNNKKHTLWLKSPGKFIAIFCGIFLRAILSLKFKILSN